MRGVNEVKAAGRRGVFVDKAATAVSTPSDSLIGEKFVIKPTPIIRQCRARPHLSCRSEEKI